MEISNILGEVSFFKGNFLNKVENPRNWQNILCRIWYSYIKKRGNATPHVQELIVSSVWGSLQVHRACKSAYLYHNIYMWKYDTPYGQQNKMCSTLRAGAQHLVDVHVQVHVLSALSKGEKSLQPGYFVPRFYVIATVSVCSFLRELT